MYNFVNGNESLRVFHESVSPKPLSKFAKVAKQLFFLNPQILGLNPQSQIRKFIRYMSPQISFD
jgi:hypothetical protein